MKTCVICKQIKVETEFYKNKARKDGLQNFCKACNSLKVKRHYKLNSEYYKSRSAIRNKQQRADHQMRVAEYLVLHPCVDCGERDIDVLDFDHVRGVKLSGVCRLIGNASWSTVEDEIRKCDVRCANCHRRKTGRELGWFRSSYSPV